MYSAMNPAAAAAAAAAARHPVSPALPVRRWFLPLSRSPRPILFGPMKPLRRRARMAPVTLGFTQGFPTIAWESARDECVSLCGQCESLKVAINAGVVVVVAGTTATGPTF